MQRTIEGGAKCLPAQNYTSEIGGVVPGGAALWRIVADTLAAAQPNGAAAIGRDETAAYRDRARRLGLPFAERVDLGAGARVNLAAIRRATFAMAAHGERLAYFAPDEAAMADARHWLHAYPAARTRLRIATPTAIRAALVAASADKLARSAVARLERAHPAFSAHRLATRGQIAAAVVATAITIAAFVLRPAIALGVFDLAGALFFFGASLLRFIAAAGMPYRDGASPVASNDDDLPVYTVLVPLRDEAAMIADLVEALDALDWPRDKLDIKLIVEADDTATVAAAHAACAGPPFEVVVVPVLKPRTKPKALAFALSLARGDLVTVYDAEDRPHPQQLRAAHAAFASAGDDLACLQASLVVDNGQAGWFARLFAIEYAALFDGLLPALVALRLPIPLGGTSNHFRREALEAVGGWDPFNVTEDADLGLRLARFGYRIATLSVPTLEEAPAAFRPWTRQRARWFKGWMQTWLVHTRRPLVLIRQLGLRGFLGFNLIGTGMVVTALVYPVYLLTVLVLINDPLNLWGSGSIFEAIVLGLNVFNIFAGYVSMSLLATRALRTRGRAREASSLIWLPIYWLLMSLASYRALIELFVRPHHWHKTPHTGRSAPVSGRRGRARP